MRQPLFALDLLSFVALILLLLLRLTKLFPTLLFYCFRNHCCCSFDAHLLHLPCSLAICCCTINLVIFFFSLHNLSAFLAVNILMLLLLLFHVASFKCSQFWLLYASHCLRWNLLSFAALILLLLFRLVELFTTLLFCCFKHHCHCLFGTHLMHLFWSFLQDLEGM